MNNDLLIETKEIGDYRIKIFYDTDAECPTSWCLGATHLFESLDNRHYCICPSCDWKELVSNVNGYSMEDLLRRLAAEVVTQERIIKYYKEGNVSWLQFVYNRSTRLWELQIKSMWRGEQATWNVDSEYEPHELKSADYRTELLEPLDEDDLIDLITNCADDIVIVQWSSCGYSQGDHLRAISYVTKRQLDERSGFNPSAFKDWKEQALSIIEGERKEIEMWAWGDVKGYVLEKKVSFTKVFDGDDRENENGFEWEEVGSCWGYYMETDELLEEVIAEYDLKETVEQPHTN